MRNNITIYIYTHIQSSITHKETIYFLLKILTVIIHQLFLFLFLSLISSLIMELESMPKFLENKTILVTGATGFLAKGPYTLNPLFLCVYVLRDDDHCFCIHPCTQLLWRKYCEYNQMSKGFIFS
jgi:hypothetical protein